ncbi:hypothetical protein L6164_014143 [Bauhinia variegata]|uniref:Uncharacterized protein n=1 Tax=Bauhinia variegata TaxID=167791 RepID=A0ACB9NGL3_BAUVA|nr:hypothetical protein L6164_014143 [Bauhinia variegata]
MRPLRSIVSRTNRSLWLRLSVNHVYLISFALFTLLLFPVLVLILGAIVTEFIPREIECYEVSQIDFSNCRSVNVVMETKGGKKKSSSSNSLQYEAPLGYSIEDVRPNGGIEKFRSAAYSNCLRKPS